MIDKILTNNYQFKPMDIEKPTLNYNGYNWNGIFDVETIDELLQMIDKNIKMILKVILDNVTIIKMAQSNYKLENTAQKSNLINLKATQYTSMVFTLQYQKAELTGQLEVYMTM